MTVLTEFRIFTGSRRWRRGLSALLAELGVLWIHSLTVRTDHVGSLSSLATMPHRILQFSK